MFLRAWDKEVPLSHCPDPPEGRYPWDMLSGTSRPGISPPTPARPSRALACQQGVPGLWGRERWCGRASPTGRPHPTTHLMGRSSCVRWTTSRERPELVPRGQRGKKERVQGEGLGRVMHTRGACVLLREWRLAGEESRQGSAERMQCSCGKRPLDAETITWVGWRLRGDSVCECAARQT